jgi:general secretion pathway protein A
MDLAGAGLEVQPFRTHGESLVTVSYGAFRKALAALANMREAPAGIALFQGPPLAGKTTIVRAHLASLPDDVSAGVIDGSGLDTRSLVESLLRQFGFSVELSTTAESLGMLRVFALQQASAGRPPWVVIENAHGLHPAALGSIVELACRRTRQHAAIKLVLASDRPLASLLVACGVTETGVRMVRDIHLHPMTRDEASEYLHSKLRAAGSKIPEYVFTQAVCSELWRASGGWPGIMDRVSLLALARARSLPVTVDVIDRPRIPRGTWPGSSSTELAAPEGPTAPPMVFVSRAGALLHSYRFEGDRLLIGRSGHNDIALDSRFVSRHHLLLVRTGNSTIAVDLNSTNGSTVNSRTVSRQVLLDNDVISIGDFRIKYSDPHATRRGAEPGTELAATATLRTLDRRSSGTEADAGATVAMSAENLPTLLD